MGYTETHFWLGLALVTGFVLTLMIIGPAMKTYTKWRTKRAFRARVKAYRQRGGEVCSKAASDMTDKA